jgi:GAF domain-containing protein
MNQPSNSIPSFWQRLTAPHPSIQDVGERRRASLLASIGLALFPLMISATIAGFISRLSQGLNQVATISSVALTFTFLITYVLARTRYYRAGSVIITMIFVASTVQLAITEPTPLNEIFYSLLPLMFIISIALFNQRGMWMLFGVTMAGMAVIAIFHPGMEMQTLVQSIGITASIAIMAIIVVRFRDSVERERLAELQGTNQELTSMKGELEQRVQDRTAELTTTSEQNEKRARNLQTISEISEAVSSEQGLEKLLPLITNAVSERFGFYHVGIFMLDKVSNFAVLHAANSPGGQRMLERDHRLEIGQVGIVGKVAASGKPRIALNVGEDAVYFNNPDLPETRSEIALPMAVSGRVIGVLDVQSVEPNAFANEDLHTLSILSNQIAIAIENARLYETTRKSLEQTETAYRQYVLNEWTRLVREEKLAGFQYVDGNSTPLKVPLDLGEIAQTVRDGNIHQVEAGRDEKSAQLAIPVKLRGEVIGILHISTPKKPRWADDDIDIAEAVAERLALSMENARLFQSSANRAARERIVSDISSKISGNIRMENILQTTAKELSQALGGSDVLIQLQTPKRALEEQA